MAKNNDRCGFCGENRLQKKGLLIDGVSAHICFDNTNSFFSAHKYLYKFTILIAIFLLFYLAVSFIKKIF